MPAQSNLRQSEPKERGGGKPRARQDLGRRDSRARPQRHPLPEGSADAYSTLAPDYEWVEPHEWHSGRAFLDRYANVLAALPAGSDADQEHMPLANEVA